MAKKQINETYADLAQGFKKVSQEMFSMRLRLVLLQIRNIKKPDRRMRELIAAFESAVTAPVRNEAKLVDLMDEFWDLV